MLKGKMYNYVFDENIILLLHLFLIDFIGDESVLKNKVKILYQV